MLEKFGLSVERGFLPRVDPLQELPGKYEAWERVANDLPKLMMGGNVRRWLSMLPLIDATSLDDPRELDRAMLLLSYFGQAWVWGEDDVSASLPAQIASPWHAVASRLGRPPVLSYASHALNNWKRLDASKPIALDNVVRLMNFYGGLDEEWFVLIHIVIESKAGHALHAGLKLQEAVKAGEPSVAVECLQELNRAIKELIAVLERMPERCDPHIYYKRVRPFIFGWHSNPALPNGLFYEGVEEWRGQGQHFRGETGAQSSIIPSLDAMLGLTFDDGTSFAEHLKQLREYMPLRHRAFVSALEAADQANPIRNFVTSHIENIPELKGAYNDAVVSVFDFRSIHLKFAASFIAQQAMASQSNPNQTGTGGTPFMAYLASHADRTRAHCL